MKRFTLMIALILAVMPLFAETITLKNGKVLYGKIMGQSRTSVRLYHDGKMETIPKSKIAKMVFDKYDEKKVEAEKKAKEAKRLAEIKKAADAKRAEELRLEQETQKAAEAKKVEDLNLSEEARLAEEAKKAAEDQKTEEITITQEDEHVSKMGALLYSALLPGWGQSKQNRVWSSRIYMYSFWGSALALAGWSGQRAVQKNDYNESIDSTFEDTFQYSYLLNQNTKYYLLYRVMESNDLKEKYFLTSRRINRTATILAGIYLFNLVDVVLFHPDNRTTINLNFLNDFASQSSSIQMNWQYRF